MPSSDLVSSGCDSDQGRCLGTAADARFGCRGISLQLRPRVGSWCCPAAPCTLQPVHDDDDDDDGAGVFHKNLLWGETRRHPRVAQLQQEAPAFRCQSSILGLPADPVVHINQIFQVDVMAGSAALAILAYVPIGRKTISCRSVVSQSLGPCLPPDVLGVSRALLSTG